MTTFLEQAVCFGRVALTSPWVSAVMRPMAIKLIIPRGHVGQAPLRWRTACRKRGAEGRWIDRERREQRARNLEAGMGVVANCAVLWGLFWFQFVVGMMYGQPALYTLSGGSWHAPAFHFYLENYGPLAWSLADMFLVLSVFASVVGLSLSWICTCVVAGKWRLRMVALLFSMIVCGWSFAALMAEDGVWVGVERDLARARDEWRHAADFGEDEWSLRFYREQVENLEKLLELKPNLPAWP
jgi:hypothetical protein